MIDGQLPAYERVIPSGNDKDVEFERDRLTSAIKRVALLSNERSRAVKVEIDKGKAEVTSSSSDPERLRSGETRRALTDTGRTAVGKRPGTTARQSFLTLGGALATRSSNFAGQHRVGRGRRNVRRTE